jgi:hypothetical protein
LFFSFNEEKKAALDQLQLLVVQNENLKKKETDFKKLSKEKITELEERNRQLEER